MVEIKEKCFWNNLAERGKSDNNLSIQLDSLSATFSKLSENEIFRTLK